MTDRELIKQYTQDRSGPAFEAIVRQYADIVYSAALRQTRKADEAEEITQAVFVILASKVNSIPQSTPLVGWLLTTTRFTAMNFRRARIRRKHHERKAATMENATTSAAAPDPWEEMAPLIDQAMASLGADQRNAVALRFFEGCPFAAIAERMGTNEEAAKKRVSRGVEKLREFFARRGVTIPSAVVSGSLTLHAVDPAPAHMIASCIASSPQASTLAKQLIRLMMIAKAKIVVTIVFAVILLCGVAATTVHVVRTRTQAAPLPVARTSGSVAAVAIWTTSGAGFHATVMGIDGKPVAGATVYESSVEHPAIIYDPPLNQQGVPELFLTGDETFQVSYANPGITNSLSTTTDAAGAFGFPPANGPDMLVAKDDHGFFQGRLVDVANGAAIQLKPWASIEGFVHIKVDHVLEPKVYLTSGTISGNRFANSVIQYISVPLGTDGHFVFPHVTPGPAWLFTKLSDNNTIGPSTFVQVRVSKAENVEIASHGITVKGKFALPAGTDQTIEWRDPRHWTTGSLIKIVQGKMNWPALWENARIGGISVSQPATDQSSDELMLPQGMSIERDGSFQFIGVRPGQYKIQMTNYESDRASNFSDRAASFETEVIVPAANDGNPLELGSLTVNMQPRLRLKQPAPSLEVSSLNTGGGPVKLYDYRGKYVVLYAWDISGRDGMDGQRAVDMAGIDEEFSGNSKVVLIGINHDRDTAAARQFVVANHLDHWIMASAPQMAGLPKEYGQMFGGAVLIDPSGTVIAEHLMGDRVETVLRRELAK